MDKKTLKGIMNNTNTIKELYKNSKNKLVILIKGLLIEIMRKER